MPVNIKFSGELNYEKETSVFRASQVIAFLNQESEEQLRVEPNRLTSSGSLMPSPEEKVPQSPKDYLDTFNVRTNAQKIAVFASYICKRDGVESFDQASVKSLFKRTGEPFPANFSRDWREAEINYFYEQSPGQFVLTDAAMGKLTSPAEVVEGKQRVSAKKSRQRVSKKSDGVRISEAVKNMEMVVTLAGFPDFFDLKTKGERILWILAFADAHDVKDLTPNEIEFMAEKLRDHLPSNSFSALSDSHFRKGRLVRSNEGKIKLLHVGFEYLRSLGQTVVAAE